MKQLLWVVCALALLAGVRAEDEVEVNLLLIESKVGSNCLIFSG